jgi:hypothetical protein
VKEQARTLLAFLLVAAVAALALAEALAKGN